MLRRPSEESIAVANSKIRNLLIFINGCVTSVIKSFRHKGLKKFFDSGSVAGIQPQHAKRLRMQLVAMDTATTLEDMDIPGFKLHPLKGSDQNRWSVWVNGNWRVTFEFHEGHTFVLDYEDYH